LVSLDTLAGAGAGAVEDAAAAVGSALISAGFLVSAASAELELDPPFGA
jgi:hypothetical protein